MSIREARRVLLDQETEALIDREVVCCDENGLAVFQVLRSRRNEPQAFLYAFDLLELNGDDLRREPIEVRKGPAFYGRAGTAFA